MWKSFILFIALSTAFGSAIGGRAAHADESDESGDRYEVMPYRHSGNNGVRGHFWISDGPADVVSSNQSVGNRFRLGGELHLGQDYRWIVGVTLLDVLSSGESSPIVGDISREGWDFNLGYFLVPDTVWLEYSFQLGTIHGSNIGGHVGTTGNALDLGYRFFNQGGVNVALDLGYIHVQSETVDTIDFSDQSFGSATYPGANIWTVALVLGFDTGFR